MRDPSLIRVEEDEDTEASVFTTNEAAYEAFMASLRSASRKKQRRYRLKLRRFLSYLDGYPLPKVTLRQYERYIANVEDRCKYLYTGRPGAGGAWIAEPGCKLQQPLNCETCPLKQRIQKRTAGEDVTVLTKFTSFLARHRAAEDNGVVHHDLVLVRGGNHQYDAAGNYIDPKRLHKAFLKASPPLGVSVAHLLPIHANDA